MDYEDFDNDDLDTIDKDFWKEGARNENHEVYHPVFICSPSSRKPGYYLPHPVGVSECTHA